MNTISCEAENKKMKLQKLQYGFIATALMAIMFCVTVYMMRITPQSQQSTAPKKRENVIESEQCAFITNKQKNKELSQGAAVTEPPWVKFINVTGDMPNPLNETVDQRPLCLSAGGLGRFGNHMFVYASLFGIAWRNRRIPVWTEDPHKLCKVFKCRIPNSTGLQTSAVGSSNVRLSDHL